MVQTQHHTGKHGLREGQMLSQAHTAKGTNRRPLSSLDPQPKALHATPVHPSQHTVWCQTRISGGISGSWTQPSGLILCSYAEILCLHTSLLPSLCFLGTRRLCLEVSDNHLPDKGCQPCWVPVPAPHWSFLTYLPSDSSLPPLELGFTPSPQAHSNNLHRPFS